MKKKLIVLIYISFILGCSHKIKSITEFSKQNSILSKSKVIEFDKKGNKLVEQNFGDSRYNRVIKFGYENGLKIYEIRCDYFQKEDTCVVRYYKKFDYGNDKNLITETFFENDSAIRFIRTFQYFNNMKIIKTMSWETSPKIIPDYSRAFVMVDTVYFDELEREIKRVHYSPIFDKPTIEILKYTRKGYSINYQGYGKDSTEHFMYNKFYRKALKSKINFNFKNNYKYKFTYY